MSSSQPFAYVPEYVFVASMTTQDRWMTVGRSTADTGVEDGELVGIGDVVGLGEVGLAGMVRTGVNATDEDA